MVKTRWFFLVDYNKRSYARETNQRLGLVDIAFFAIIWLQTENVSSFSCIMAYPPTNYHIFTNTKLPLTLQIRMNASHHTLFEKKRSPNPYKWNWGF
jgi:hypothetical protein